MDEHSLHTRIAPTPSGFLHLGNAMNFLLTWLKARKSGGTVRLRIDDMDVLRMKAEYLSDIFETIEWMGIDYDFGPTGPDDQLRNYTQKYRTSACEEAIKELWESHDAFACTCSRSTVRNISPDGIYPGTCRDLKIPVDTPLTNIRLKIPIGTYVEWKDEKMGQLSISLYDSMRDFVLKRKDDVPSYQITSLLEDVEHGINYIVRGADLIPSTAAQLFLAKILNIADFQSATFHHHLLLTDGEGEKLSKSAGSLSIRQLRKKWKTPGPLFKKMGTWLGNEEADSLEGLLECMD